MFNLFNDKEVRNSAIKTVSPSDGDAWKEFFGLDGTITGEIVTEEKALGVPAIWQAVNAIAGTISALPLHLYEKTSSGMEKATDNYLYRPTGFDAWYQAGVYSRDTQSVEIGAVTADTAYEVAISYRSIVGAVSDRLIFTGVIAGNEAFGWSAVTGPGRPQDGATVGAPGGTVIGDRPVEDVLGDLDDTKGATDQLRTDLDYLLEMGTLPDLPALRADLDTVAENASIGMSAADRLARAGDDRITRLFDGKLSDETTARDTALAELGNRLTDEETKRSELSVTVNATNAKLVTEETVRAGETAALASRIDTTQANIGAVDARVTTEHNAWVNGDAATSQALTTLVSNTDTATRAVITQQAKTQSDAVSAVSGTLNALSSKVNDPATGLEKAHGLIVQESQTRANQLSAVATDYSGLLARMNTAEGAISTERTARVDADGVFTNSLNSLTANFNNPSTGLAATRSWISQEAQASADRDSANATQTNALKARMDNFRVAGVSLEASFADLSSAVISDSGAVAQRVNSVQTNLAGQISGVSQTLQTTRSELGVVQNAYTMKLVDGNRVVGLVMTNGTNEIGQMRFQADRIVFTDGAGNGTVPFVVTGGQTYITDATIRTASINELKIAGNSIGVPFSQTFGDQSVGQYAAVTVAETGWVTTGDASGGAGLVLFTGHQNGVSAVDAKCVYNLYVDTGAGWSFIRSYGIGARGTSGDVESHMTVAITHAYSGASVRVMVTAQSAMIGNEGASRTWIISNPNVSILGTKR